jgi:hypothetical protein
MRLLILAILVLLTGHARAEDFAARFPPGSITTREQADAAVRAAQQEEARQKKLFDAREAECYRAVLVNDCREKVRHERELTRREVRRIELEAKDAKRRIDQEELAKRRAEEEKQRAALEAGRADKEAAARKQTEQRSSEAAAKAAGGKTPEEAVQNRANYDRKQQEHADKLAKEQQDAAKHAQNAAEYKQKQADAAKRAQDAEVERKKREARREERKQTMEKKEAEREALRKRAEEAAASAPR